jgi:biotin synthase
VQRPDRGLGETDEQLVEALFALRDLDSDSIPVNFLMPFDGTPYENTGSSTPRGA